MHTSASSLFTAAAFSFSALLFAGSAIAGDLSSAFASPPSSFVPWRVAKPGEEPPRALLVVYWIPVSPEDFRHSELLSYRPLSAYLAQCVSLQVIRSDDVVMIEKLGATGRMPTVVLTSGDGRVVASVNHERGMLRGSAVEKMIRDEIRAREDSLDRDLDDAPKRAGLGDRETAIALYRRVWEQRCLFPRHGREAARALRKLGQPVVTAASH